VRCTVTEGILVTAETQGVRDTIYLKYLKREAKLRLLAVPCCINTQQFTGTNTSLYASNAV
jgi:hypothetical protein